MPNLLVVWLLFPVVMAVLALGVGALAERVSGRRLPGALLVPLGLAGIVVVAQFTTTIESTAKLTTPLVLALALVGIASRPWRERRVDRWALLAGLGAFGAFAAPVALSGEATWPGYIKLDDTATWFALTDRVMEHGRSIEGLAPSSYEAALFFNLAKGYPLGTFLPLGVGTELSGSDVAWVFHPYVALLAGMLALCLYAILEAVLRRGPVRALAALLAAQPALLFGYALWGGVKEVAGALLVAAAAALLFAFLRSGRGGRAAVPPALALAGAVAVMSPVGALVWMGPLLLPAFVATAGAPRPARSSTGRLGGSWRPWLALAVATAAFTVPWLPGAGIVPPTSSPLTDPEAQGNLYGPLNPLQVLGVWPAGDFRGDPERPALATVLVAVTLAAALGGLYAAWRRRAATPIVYVVGTLAAAAAIWLVGSPWVEAKALAIASPAPLLAAMIACAALLRIHAVAAAVLTALVAGGVIGSNVLAYQNVNLASGERYAELERIGRGLEGRGPTLIPEYEPYGARHFLRAGDPESVSSLRRREIARRNQETVPKGDSADIDELALEGVLEYRTLVIRRSPLASRPPGVYRHVGGGRFFDVWRRPSDVEKTIVEHLPLGSETDASAGAPCDEVRSLAATAGTGGALVASVRPDPIVVDLPAQGLDGAQPSSLSRIEFSTPRPGAYSVWLAGRTRSLVEVAMDGRAVGTIRHELNYPGHLMPVGIAVLTAGPHRATVASRASAIHPGEQGPPLAVGPLVLAPAAAGEHRLIAAPASNARSLCGPRLDWIEAVAAG